MAPNYRKVIRQRLFAAVQFLIAPGEKYDGRNETVRRNESVFTRWQGKCMSPAHTSRRLPNPITEYFGLRKSRRIAGALSQTSPAEASQYVRVPPPSRRHQDTDIVKSRQGDGLHRCHRMGKFLCVPLMEIAGGNRSRQTPAGTYGEKRLSCQRAYQVPCGANIHGHRPVVDLPITASVLIRTAFPRRRSGTL